MVDKFGFGFGMNDFKTWASNKPAVAEKTWTLLCVIAPRYPLGKSIPSSGCHVKSNHFNILVLQVSHEVANILKSVYPHGK